LQELQPVVGSPGEDQSIFGELISERIEPLIVGRELVPSVSAQRGGQYGECRHNGSTLIGPHTG